MSSRASLISKCQSILHRYHRQIIVNHNRILKRHVSQMTVNHELDLDPDVKSKLDKKEYKHRQHPGILKIPHKVLPQRLQESMQILLEKYPSKNIQEEAEKLCRRLWSRSLPVEDEALQSYGEKLEQELMEQLGKTEELSADSEEKLQQKVQKKVLRKLKQHVYHWQPVRYDAYKSLQYMVGRMSHDFTVLYKILNEISVREPAFRPQSMMDFGSGVGSSVWAANTIWKDSLQEHVCVDSSSEMNTLAQLLLQDGLEDNEMCFKNVHFRQFMSFSTKTKFDLVISAYSLLELPNQAERLKYILNLWRKTGEFLVVVENGTNAGFRLINEIRQFITELQEEENLDSRQILGHVFSPCPHDAPCPRVARNDGTPCNFDISFEQYPSKSSANFKSRYSYLVLRKGRRKSHMTEWPRVVRPPSNPSRRVTIQMCTVRCTLETSTITSSKHGQDLYWCARRCTTGDLLPVIPRQDNMVHSDPDNHTPREDPEQTIREAS